MACGSRPTSRHAASSICDRRLSSSASLACAISGIASASRQTRSTSAYATWMGLVLSPKVTGVVTRVAGGGRSPRAPRCGARGGRRQPRAFTNSVSFGTIACRSPTTPKSAKSKMGAFGSLLIAMITWDDCMPTLCWIAPEMPTAM